MSNRPVHYIGGKWKTSMGTVVVSINPATNDIVWEGPSATETEVDAAIAAAQSTNWALLPLEKRIEFLHAFRHNLEADKQKLAETISVEMGKPLWESLNEVEAMRNKIAISIDAYHIRCSERVQKGTNVTSITMHKPHGVVAVFGPFNFPGHLPNGHIIPALLAGNTVIFKPSEHTPLVGELIAKCWEKSGIPPGVFNMLQGGRDTGRLLAHHPHINGLFFTGSWPTGKILREHFSTQPGKILALELGGNNPFIVWDVQDIETAAYLTIQSAYLTSGQRCTCARRLIIPDTNYGENFLGYLREMIGAIQIGYYKDSPEPFMGPVISEQAAQHLIQAQESLIKSGAESLISMKHFKKGTGFVTPALIDITHAANRIDEEYFGPLLQVYRANNFAEALAEANNTEYGLAAGLLSDREEYYQLFKDQIHAGIIAWNTQLTGASSAAPFGGIGKSGNFRPSAFYAADYCAYPVAAMESPKVHMPEKATPGLKVKHER